MEHLLEVKDVTKIYEGGVLANHNVNFTVDEGEIHALVGENGAGKSTLMKMLYGLESITSGHIYMKGRELKLQSSKEAIEHGIGMVHQHFMLVDSLTGAENMMLGLDKLDYMILAMGCLVVFLISFLKERGIQIRESLGRKPLVIRWAVYGMLVFGIPMFGYVMTTTGGFIYAQF